MHRIKTYITEIKRMGHFWQGKKSNRRIPKPFPVICHKMWLLQVLRRGRASIAAHAIPPHLRDHSILVQIVENGSSYPLCAFHNIFPLSLAFFFQKTQRSTEQQAN
jgi:hypothetical protein